MIVVLKLDNLETAEKREGFDEFGREGVPREDEFTEAVEA